MRSNTAQRYYAATLVQRKGGLAMRDARIVGWYFDPPEVGQRFVQYGPPRGGVGLRRILTSLVKRVETLPNGVLEFTTQSGSVYRLEPAE